ncbi:hypothetical protein [Actinacidiphila bryophytorum]|uniref:Uncharacterized protein n=1 Tax=Actinacidiphila bryophytorum TaxID=1436133 RepID=A0A9W4E1A5_9ACTN|nr:hypothetical protein [Actinacidiphila bryophytorum]MBM9438396.1 hypothetical protein [Actinacidiphila bryophytorum]MBN6543476.1 hypothetical protein [Actinacidiphila bryophytorum]CAG7614113.1 conserved hypothetical protein [Actinacidiphila bryophytorum]
MTQPSLFPSLAAWMAATPAAHPLRDLFDAADESDHPTSFRRSILQAFDDVIRTLEEAQPMRLAGPKRDFVKARTDDDVAIVRAELVAGAKLARAGVAFDFGPRNGSPEPDLILRSANLGVEVKARRLNGLKDLEQELEAALDEIDAPVIVHLFCTERPLVIKKPVREAIIKETVDRVQSGQRGTAITRLEQRWAATPVLDLGIRLFDAGPFGAGSRVVVENGFELSGHLQDVSAEVLAVLADEQKINQAEARPTILLIDMARTGLAWMRSPQVWATCLADLLPDSTPFVGVGVMIPTLDNSDVPIALALRKNAQAEALDAAKKLAFDLGLELNE